MAPSGGLSEGAQWEGTASRSLCHLSVHMGVTSWWSHVQGPPCCAPWVLGWDSEWGPQRWVFTRGDLGTHSSLMCPDPGRIVDTARQPVPSLRAPPWARDTSSSGAVLPGNAG